MAVSKVEKKVMYVKLSKPTRVYSHVDGRVFYEGKVYEVSEKEGMSLLRHLNALGSPYFVRVAAESVKPVPEAPAVKETEPVQAVKPGEGKNSDEDHQGQLDEDDEFHGGKPAGGVVPNTDGEIDV